MTAYTLTTHETLVGQPFTLLEASSDASDTLTISAEGALEQTSAGVSALLMQTGTQLFNRGTITGTTTGIAMVGGASISNYAAGLIQAADAAVRRLIGPQAFFTDGTFKFARCAPQRPAIPSMSMLMVMR